MLTKPNPARIALVAAVVVASAAAAVVAASAAAAMVAVAATARSANPGGNQTQALDSNHLSFESPRRVVRKRTLPTATGLALRNQSRLVLEKHGRSQSEGVYEFFSIGTCARTSARLRVSRVYRTHPDTNQGDSTRPQRPGSNRLR